MRIVGLAAVLVVTGCVASEAPDANGYNVQLYFEGAPLGSTTPIDTPARVIVKRLEQRTDRCEDDSTTCDPTTETPITLLSAACDSICNVVALPTSDGSISLQATANAPGATTLRVRVRSEVDGAEWDDGYPLSFAK